MTIYLKIQRKMLTILTDAKDDIQIFEVKKIIEGIIKVSPEKQRLYTKNEEVMDDARTLSDYGYNTNSARALSPGFIGLALMEENGEFESLDVVPYSTPADLPNVLIDIAERQEST